MFCGKCGVEVSGDVAFCPSCGAAIPKLEDLEGDAPLGGQAGSDGADGKEGAIAPTDAEDAQVVGEAAAGDAAGGGEPGDGETAPEAPEAPDAAAAAAGVAAAGVGESGTETAPEPATAEPSPKKKRTGIIAGAVVAVLVICVGIGVGVWWKSDQDAKAAEAARIAAEQAEWERTHVTRVTRLNVEAPAFGDSSTGIPVQVTGTDLDGNPVSEIQYMHADNTTVSTMPGTYELTFPGGYFGNEGEVVKAPETKLTVEVPVPAKAEGEASATGTSSGSASPQGEGGQSASASPANSQSAEAAPASGSASGVSSQEAGSGSSQSASSGSASTSSESASSESASSESASSGASSASAVAADESVVTGETPVFTVVEPLEVTDELLKQIGDLAKGDPIDSGKAEDLQKKATQVRDDAVAEEKRRIEEEERRAREEAERAEAMGRLNGWWNTIGNSGMYWYHIHDGVSDGYEVDVFKTKKAKRTGTATIESVERATSPDMGEGYYVTFVGGSGGYFLADDNPDTLYITDSSLRFKSASDSIARANPPDSVLNAG